MDDDAVGALLAGKLLEMRSRESREHLNLMEGCRRGG